MVSVEQAQQVVGGAVACTGHGLAATAPATAAIQDTKFALVTNGNERVFEILPKLSPITAKCSGIVVLTTGMLISLTFVVLPEIN